MASSIRGRGRALRVLDGLIDAAFGDVGRTNHRIDFNEWSQAMGGDLDRGFVTAMVADGLVVSSWGREFHLSPLGREVLDGRAREGGEG